MIHEAKVCFAYNKWFWSLFEAGGEDCNSCDDSDGLSDPCLRTIAT